MMFSFLFALITFNKAIDNLKNIPISVPIEAMKVSGDRGCNHIECPKEFLSTEPCGTRCWYNPKSKKIKPTYEYEFKGEKFEVYGTWDKNHGSMAVYINETLIKIIDQSQHERKLYALQYTSDIMPYGLHRIKIAAYSGDSEFYKLAYWPSINAIRMNSTEMQPPWGKDSDGIGGLIEWNNGNHYGYKTAKIKCSKIWVYGSLAMNHNILKLHIGDQIHKINLHKEGRKINSTLVFETDYMPFDDYLLTFEHDGGIQFSCIYYLPFPPPSSTPPISPSPISIPPPIPLRKKPSFQYLPDPNYLIRSGAKSEELTNLKKCTSVTGNSISPPKLKDNIKLHPDGDTIIIGQTTIKFNSIKESFYLGLNEAFSSSTNETEFILVSGLFQKIVESNVDETYSDISEQILKKFKENSESLLSQKEISDVHNELFNLLSILCPSSNEDDIKTVIKQYGGMINYIVPVMSEISCLSPQKKLIEIKQPFIAAGLLLLYNEVLQTKLIKTSPFSVWKQSKNGSIELTRIARKRISSSNHPCLVMLFGSLRTGKSTLASHLVSGPQTNLSKTLFKSAGTAKSCTYLINAVGPIKCKNLASSFNIIQDDFRNSNWNRDIFIIDSEGLNSINYETTWLKQALLAMLPVNTITIYVAKSTNKADLDQFMKYLRLVRVIGGIKIHHGLGYIDNQEKFDGSNVFDQLLEQNKYTTNEIINEFDKTSVRIDDSHFKCLSVLSFDRHGNEYYKSLGEVARFITNLCLNEGTVMTGDMIIDMLEEFADKTNGIVDINETDKMFEVIFLHVLENAMKKSINEQSVKIQNEIRQKLILLPIQELNLLDIDAFITKIEEGGLVTRIINEAVSKTLPDIPDSFPVIINSSRTEIIDIIKNTVRQERLKLISTQALEVPDLGSGFSVTDGTFKKKVFNLNFSQNLTEIKLNDDVFVAYHFPEFTVTKLVPLKYQQFKTSSHSSLDDYMSHFASHFSDSSSFGFVSEKLSFDKARKVATNLMGITFSTNSPEQNVSISVSVNSAAQVHFDNDVDLKQHLAPNLRKLFNDMNDILHSKEIKSDEVKKIASEIFNDYGESVATGFFIGNYEIDISHNDKLTIESSGQAAFSSSKSGSSGIGGFGIKLGKSSSSQESKETKFNSKVHDSAQEHTIVSYGSVEQPATFMFDIAEGSSYGSSFVPIWKYAPSVEVEDALKYWAGRWNMKPQTLPEYMFLNDLKNVPQNQTITLYYKNKAYQVYINNKSEIIIPDSEIRYEFSTNEEGRGYKTTTIQGVILNPSKMTIGGFISNPYVKRWKRRTGHHSRAFGYESNLLFVKLGPFFEFDQDIISAYFKGEGTNFMILNNIDSHSFNIGFRFPGEAGGKSWTVGPYYVQLQTNLKVRLV